MAMPTANFAAAMPALAKIEIAATRDLTLGTAGLMRGGLAARHATLKPAVAIASRCVCCELFRI